MKNIKSVLALLCIVSSSVYAQGWSSLYAIDIARQYRNSMRDQHTLVVERVLPMPASQLIFSWNGYRPSHGYYVFYVQVRAKGAASWSNWYKIAEWGQNTQRSFERLLNQDPSFCYVRLEMPDGTYAYACRVKIEAYGQASMRDVARFNISAADYQQFVSEVGKTRYWSLPSVFVHKIPAFSQMETRHPERERICSPTSLAMVVSYLLKRHIDPMQFADGVYDDGLKSYGSWPFNVAHAFALTDGHYYFAVTRLNSFAHLYNYVRRKLPVVVSVRGPLRTMPSGKTYADGHLLVVVGWDNEHKRVMVLDPAFETSQSVHHSYAIDDFLAAWERSYRLAYVIEPAGT
jgi:hypothetical protein